MSLFNLKIPAQEILVELVPVGIGVTSVAFISHGKGKMAFLWTLASPVSVVDAGDGFSFDASGLVVDGQIPTSASGVMGSGVYFRSPTVQITVTYPDTGATSAATYLIQSQPPGVVDSLQVGETGLTT